MSDEQQAVVNEKYFNYYVETLSQTLNQQVLANVSAQAKAKVNNEVLLEWQKQNETLKQQLEDLNSKILQIQNDLNEQIEKLKTESLSTQSAKEQQKNAEIDRLKNIITNKDSSITNLQTEVNKLNQLRAEHEKIKHQVTHIDTFRNELIKTQKIVEEKNTEIQNVISEKDSIIKELNDKIDYLQLTPAKRKKVDAINKPDTEEVLTILSVPDDVSSNEIIKDGGVF
jgi:DNA repair exonuclease SbcCD ATPase subunit